MQPTRIREAVDLYRPLILHRLIALVPVSLCGWYALRGEPLPMLFYGILGATVLFHLLVGSAAHVRLSPTGLKFAKSDAPEILWSDLKQVKSGPSSIDLVLVSGETVQIAYSNLRSSDAEQLRQMIKGQVLAMSAEAKSLARADPITAVVNTNLQADLPRADELPPLPPVDPASVKQLLEAVSQDQASSDHQELFSQEPISQDIASLRPAMI